LQVERVFLNALATNAVLPPVIIPSATSLPVRARLAFSGEANPPLPYCAWAKRCSPMNKKSLAAFRKPKKGLAEPNYG
jgi:hypothetical protein